MAIQRQKRKTPAQALRGAVRGAVTRARTAFLTMRATVHSEPVIILGNPRSGTTTVAALLADMTGLDSSLGLKKEMKHPTVDKLKRGTLSMADFVESHKLDFSRKIIEEPGLSLVYEELLEFFPAAKSVMVIRDPRDNLRSILTRLNLSGHLRKLSVEQWRNMHPAWRLIVDNKWLGLDGDNYIEMMAHRWNHVTDTYLRHKEDLILVKYEEFLKDKAATIAWLADILELPQARDIAGRVDIECEPASDHSVTWEKFFGPRNLAAIERICRERMTVMHYVRTI